MLRPAHLIAIMAASAALTTPVLAQEAPANRWTGFYIGADVGGGSGRLEGTTTDLTGATAGGHIGYNWQSSKVVLGIEGDLSSTSYGHSETINLTGGSVSFDVGHDYFTSVRGKLGFTDGPVMLYGTFGVAFTQIDFSSTVTGAGIDVAANRSVDVSGIIGGMGLEYAFSPNVSLRGEAMWFELHPDFDFSQPAYDGNMFRAGLSYKFN